MTDQIEVSFIDANGNHQNIKNWTEYDIQKDFFDFADGFTLVLEDDRLDQLTQHLEVGMRLEFKINKFNILVGYIDSIDLAYTRGGHGKSLTIRGRDVCGLLSDAHVYPNLGLGGNTQYQFNPLDKLSDALNVILTNGLTPIENLFTNDLNGNLQLLEKSQIGNAAFSTGFGTGIKVKGRNLSKSYNSNLEKLCKPEKGESYIGYATRLATRAGCFIKCMPGTDNALLISPPTYQRVGFSAPYNLNHIYIQSTVNNIHEGRLKISYKNQPSVIIGEANHGGPTFRKETQKVVCINEFTGYVKNTQTLDVSNSIPSVKNALQQLTTGPINENNSGYLLLAPNLDLYSVATQNVIGTTAISSRPYYYVDYNAETPEELIISVAELMAKFQDDFLELEYTVDNHTNNGVPWNTNLMCNVSDEAISPNQCMTGQFWIQKVNFTKSRGGGTETKLLLRLPYTHVVNFTS